MLKEWVVASRPWSYTASAVPIFMGAAYAWWLGADFQLGLFLLTLIGGILIQAGTNYINTYGDHLSGVDTVESAVNCPQLVTGMMDPKAMKKVGIGCFTLAALIGLFLVWVAGWPILVLGILGILGGYTYTAGISYKYAGLGSILVFFLMGPMMVLGSYWVQMQYAYGVWEVILISLPIALLVSSILHGNDIRDIEDDRKAGIKTLAMMIDSDFNYTIYKFQVIGAYVTILLLVLVTALTDFKFLPLWSLLILLTLPLGISQVKHAEAARKGDMEKLKVLEMSTAQFHAKFGTVYVLSMVIAIVVGIFW